MASYCEPMDVDESELDDKENTYRLQVSPPGGAAACTPVADRGCSELDASEVNMKLRLSCTPLASPSPRQFTGSCKKLFPESGDNDYLYATKMSDESNVTLTELSMGDFNGNSPRLQHSTNSTVNSQIEDHNQNTTVLHQSSQYSDTLNDCLGNNNTTITLEAANGDDIKNSSVTISNIPCDTTPTKDIPKTSTSPIMRGLKSMLSMFRPSQSPITSEDNATAASENIISNLVFEGLDRTINSSEPLVVSTPELNTFRKSVDQVSIKESSPHVSDRIVFNEDLINDLHWNDDSTIIFNKNKLPGRKLYTPSLRGSNSSFESHSRDSIPSNDLTRDDIDQRIGYEQNQLLPAFVDMVADNSVEYMDISMNETNQSVKEDSAIVNESEHREYIKSMVEGVLESVYECAKISAEASLAAASIGKVESYDIKEKSNDPLPDSAVSLSEDIKKDTGLSKDYILNSNTKLNDFPNGVVKFDHENLSKSESPVNLSANSINHLVDNTNLQTVSICEVDISEAFSPSMQAETETTLVQNSFVKTVINNQLICEEPRVEALEKQAYLQHEEIIVTHEKNILGVESIKGNPPVTEEADYDKKQVTDSGIVEIKTDVPNITLINTVHSNNKEDTEIEQNKVLLNSVDKIGNFGDDEIIMSENDRHCVSLNALTNVVTINNLPVSKASGLNYDEIENPFATKSRISLTPPPYEIHFDEIQNPGTTQSKVTMSPLRNMSTVGENVKADAVPPPALDEALIKNCTTLSNENANEFHTSVEINNETQIANISTTDVKDVSIEGSKSTNFDKAPIELPIQNDDVIVIKDRAASKSISLDIPGEKDNVNSIESQEQSDAYLSANSSGRESEQLLECELENIEKTYRDEIKHQQKNLNTQETIEQCSDPFVTKTIIRMSPPLGQNNVCSNMNNSPITHSLCQYEPKVRISNAQDNMLSPAKVNSAALIPDGNDCTLPNDKFEFISKTTMSPQQEFGECDNPFATKTKIRMSPPLSCDDTLYNEEEEKPLIKEPSYIKSDSSFIISAEPTHTHLQQKFDTHIEDTLFADTNSSKLNNTFVTKINVDELGCQDSSPTLENPLNSDIESPFVTKCKIRTSPPPECKRNVRNVHNLEPITHNIDNESQPTLFKEPHEHHNAETNTTFELSVNNLQTNLDTNMITKSDIDLTVDFKNHDVSADFPVNDCSEKDVTISPGSGDNSMEKENTIREVKTEDEDTMEGPEFVGLELEDTDNPFQSQSKTSMFTAISDEPLDTEGTGPKVIICRDVESATSINEYEVQEQEFLECSEEEFKPAELFINSDTFDFLMSKNASNDANDNGKESLFLKFDPLCANKRTSTGVLSALANIGSSKRSCQTDITEEETPQSDPPPTVMPGNIFNQTQENVNSVVITALSTPPEKPMLAVMPAVNNEPTMSPRRGAFTPTRPERRSITFSSPAIAAIDRLISLSGNNSPVNQTYYSENHIADQESNVALIELRDLLAEKEYQVEQLRSEARGLQERLSDVEIKMKSLEEDNEVRLKKISDLQSKLALKTALNKNMAAVVEEYERVISGMIGENEQEKQRHDQERALLIRERDEQVAHLNSMEVSFSDLHTKYERTKQVILTYKSNEEELRKVIQQFKDSQEKLEKNCEALKQQAVTKLNNVNMELEKLKKNHEAEVCKLTALVKRKEMHAMSLEETLAQKIKANEELTAICDELISKVG